MPLPTQKPTKKQLLYGKFSPDLYRLTGGEETDSLLDVIDADMSATNAGSVQTSASDIGGGGSSANTTVVANGSVEAGKTSFDNTVAGYILGVDPTNGAAKFYIGNTSSYLNWDGATLTIVGGVAISQLNIPDLVTANSFHVDSSGNAWWGATTIGSATAKVLDTGVATFSNANITGGSVATSTLNVAVMGWTTDIVFSSANATQVNWTSGHIVVTSGTTYTISSGNTGTMSALTYIYLDTAVSTTVLQTTTTYSAATGASCILIATAQNNTVGASVIPQNGSQAVIDGANLTPLSILSGNLGAGSVTSSKGNLALRGWTQTCTFSVTDADTITWGAGTFTASDGTAYSILTGNTGNMVAKTYVYLDIGTSTTAYQITTTAATAVGDGKVLIAICQNNTTEAVFTLLNNNSQNIDASNIVAGSLTANEIAASTITGSKIAATTIAAGNLIANTITAGQIAAGTITTNEIAALTIVAGNIAASTITSAKMSVSQLSAIAADMGSITSGSITVVSGSDTVAITPGSTNAIISGPTGSPTFILTTAGALTATSATVNGTILSNQDAFGDGSDGPATISGDTTLTRDMFYTNLTINSTNHLYTASFRVFVNGTLTNNGTIDNSGNAASGSTGGAAIASGSLVGTVAGQNGGVARTITSGGYNGNAGTAGTSVAKSIGSAGVAGGAGGNGGGTGGVAGSAGSQTGTVFNSPHTFVSAYNLFDAEPSGSFAVFGLAAGSGSGGSGAVQVNGTASGTTGYGGGSGSPGGIVWISARQLVNNGVISAKGGAGANGGNASGSGAYYEVGGGGGGAGGAGGVIIMIYSQLTGSGTVNIAAGTSGTGGNLAQGGTGYIGYNGSPAATANAGIQISLQI